METNQNKVTDKNRRDILNFTILRNATPSDDLELGKLLLYSFSVTNAEKMPSLTMNDARVKDLLNVSERRKAGEVLVLELGHRLVGTFSLIRSGFSICEAWLPGAVNLRCVAVDPGFQGLGFSQMLLQRVREITKEWNAPAICLHVQKGAHGVARLYSQNGYRRDPVGDFTKAGYQYEAYAYPLELANEPSVIQ